MKKFILLLCGVLAIGISGFAQGNNATSDPAAKKVLDAVSAKFKTFKGVQSSFSYKVEDGKGKVQGSEKGTVYMKGPKYRVDIGGRSIFCDGKNIWTYEKAANEVTITQLDPSASTITPQKLFTDFYDKDFLYKLNGEKTVAGKVMQEIEMTPIDKTKTFHKVYITIDKKNKTIHSTRVLEKNGNKYTYTVNNLNGQTTLSDGLFVFDKKKYPGVEEVDLR